MGEHARLGLGARLRGSARAHSVLRAAKGNGGGT